MWLESNWEKGCIGGTKEEGLFSWINSGFTIEWKGPDAWLEGLYAWKDVGNGDGLNERLWKVMAEWFEL